MKDDCQRKWCEYDDFRCTPSCALSAAEDVIVEAHRHWHSCRDHYHDPEEFRISLSALLQALRNVTFVLQSQKSLIPDFEDWYAAEQEKMREDQIMRWLVKSRNEVVKQGKLERFSKSYVSVICDYEDEAEILKKELDGWNSLLKGPEVDTVSINEESGNIATIEKPVEMNLPEIVDSLYLDSLPLSYQQRLIIHFERRWVMESLPDYEILTALAYCYAQLRLLLLRAHQLTSDAQEGKPQVYLITSCNGQTPLESDGRLPCMRSTLDFRSTRLRFRDGSEVTEYRNVPVEFDPDLAQEIIESGRYQLPTAAPHQDYGLAQDPEDLRRLLYRFVGSIKAILLAGEDHGWFTYYFRYGVLLDTRIHAAWDEQAKRAVATEIARVALTNDADAVVMISEVWTSGWRTTIDGAIYPPSVNPQRGQAVLITALARSGAHASLILPFEVISESEGVRKVRLGEETESNTGLGLFAPLAEVWNLARQRAKGEAFWMAQQAARNRNCKPVTT